MRESEESEDAVPLILTRGFGVERKGGSDRAGRYRARRKTMTRTFFEQALGHFFSLSFESLLPLIFCFYLNTAVI